MECISTCAGQGKLNLCVGGFTVWNLERKDHLQGLPITEGSAVTKTYLHTQTRGRTASLLTTVFICTQVWGDMAGWWLLTPLDHFYTSGQLFITSFWHNCRTNLHPLGKQNIVIISLSPIPPTPQKQTHHTQRLLENKILFSGVGLGTLPEICLWTPIWQYSNARDSCVMHRGRLWRICYKHGFLFAWHSCNPHLNSVQSKWLPEEFLKDSTLPCIAFTIELYLTVLFQCCHNQMKRKKKSVIAYNIIGTVGNDWKNDVPDTKGWNEFSSLRLGEKLSHPEGARSKGAVPKHIEEQAYVAWASVSDVSWTPGEVLWESAPDQTHWSAWTEGSLRALYFQS